MTKKFLTRQDENIEEYGISINEESPVSPITNQVYFDKTNLQIKLSTDLKDFILSEKSRTKQLELTSNNIFIKDAEVFIADLALLTSSGSYSLSTIFDDGLSEEISYTKDGDVLALSMWLKIPLTPSGLVTKKNIFSYPKEDSVNALSLYIEEDDLILEKNNNKITYAFTENEWIHIICVYDDTTGSTLYINGQQAGTTLSSGALPISGTIIFTSDDWSGKISNIEVWNKDLTIDSFLLYKRGYQKSPSFITYPTGLQHHYLMGDGLYYNINFDYLNLEDKNVKVLINNSTFSPSVVNFLTEGSEEKISNITPTEDPVENYIKNNSKRIATVSSTNGVITTNYRDFDLDGIYFNKDETESQNAVLNKRPVYSLDIPEPPILSLSAVFDNVSYYTVQTTEIPVTGNSLSVSCWIKMNPSDTTQQIFKYGDFEFFLNGTTLTLKKGTLITGTATFDLSNPANQGWNHFVATWSYAGPGTGDLYAYRNGVQIIGQTGQNDDGGFGTAPSGILGIGANPDDADFKLFGKMANFEFWHDKLTQADSALLYGNGYYKNPSAIVLKTLALHYLMGDHSMDTYLELNSMTLNDIKALATGIILFDKNDIP